MSNLIIVRSGDIYVIFNHDNDMFNIQELSDFIGCKSVLLYPLEGGCLNTI